MAVFPQESTVKVSSPFNEQLQFRNLSGNAGLEGKEIRKRKRLFPRRAVNLVYDTITKAKATVLFAFYIARGGGFEVFTYFFPRSDTYVKEYVNVGDGVTTDFDTPSLDATSVSVYLDDVLQTVTTHYTFTQEAGSDGGDEISFVSPPSDGAKITMSFTGYLRLRAKFAEDNMSFDTFYRVLTSTGLPLQGVLNDE